MSYILPILILTVLILTLIGAWRSNTDKLTDQDLHGMDADEYLKKQVSEDYYNKYYNNFY